MSNLIEHSNLIIVLIVFGVSLFILSKAADILVDHAVKLSKIWGLPEIIIGATIVSLGTTLPELSASVTSALQGNGSFALGNAVGSIITNTSLIIGIGALFGKIPVDKKTSQKLRLLIVAIFLLILPTIPYKIMGKDGRIPRCIGILFLILIPVYIYYLINQDKKKNSGKKDKELIISVEKNNKVIIIVGIIFLSALVIAASSSALVKSSEILAIRVGIPDVIIASTLVAFGTSVPELSTCISAAKRKHGGLALGNIMGANILNILLVLGASVTLTKGGLGVSQDFYSIHFVALVMIIGIFSYFSFNSKIDEISKREGSVLIMIYTLYIGANLLIGFIGS